MALCSDLKPICNTIKPAYRLWPRVVSHTWDWAATVIMGSGGCWNVFRMIIRRFGEHLSGPIPCPRFFSLCQEATFKISWITYTYFPLGPLESLDLGRKEACHSCHYCHSPDCTALNSYDIKSTTLCDSISLARTGLQFWHTKRPALTQAATSHTHTRETESPWPMIGENQQLVTDEPVEIQDCRKITDHFREICRIYPQYNKGKPKDFNM